MMLFNRRHFLKDFGKQKHEASTYGNIKKNM